MWATLWPRGRAIVKLGTTLPSCRHKTPQSQSMLWVSQTKAGRHFEPNRTGDRFLPTSPPSRYVSRIATQPRRLFCFKRQGLRWRKNLSWAAKWSVATDSAEGPATREGSQAMDSQPRKTRSKRNFLWVISLATVMWTSLPPLANKPLEAARFESNGHVYHSRRLPVIVHRVFPPYQGRHVYLRPKQAAK